MVAILPPLLLSLVELFEASETSPTFVELSELLVVLVVVAILPPLLLSLVELFDASETSPTLRELLVLSTTTGLLLPLVELLALLVVTMLPESLMSPVAMLSLRAADCPAAVWPSWAVATDAVAASSAATEVLIIRLVFIPIVLS